MLFLKEHVIGDYEWTGGDRSAVYAGTASRRRFDRFNGYQMLFLINLYGAFLDTFTVQEGRKLEMFLQDQLPLGILSEISVLSWLQKTYNSAQG